MLISTSLLLSLAVFLAIFANHVSSHGTKDKVACIHDRLDLPLEVPETLVEDAPGRVLASYANIRILFDPTPLADVEADKRDYIVNALIPTAERYLEATLKVIPYSGKLGRGDETVCGDIPVPAVYLTTGVDADLVIFITTTDEPNDSYLAYARACSLSGENFRPIFGQINFNLAYLTPSENPVNIKDDIMIALHEITHVLGFSSSLYQYFINPTTKKQLTGHVLSQKVNGQTIQVLNLSPLTNRIRTYFGCSRLTGAYLENDGGDGSAGSHFERRIFFNEYMTASAITDSRITQFSLALLEGTGWYQVDYNMAEPFTYGKNRGCAFLDSSCLTANNKAAFAEFCDVKDQEGCSWTNRGVTYCPFNDPDYMDPFADQCAVPRVYMDLDCENKAHQSANADETFGLGSKCFTGTLNIEVNRPAYCLQSQCELKSSGAYNVKVQVGKTSVSCAKAGSIAVPGYTGTLTCPDPATFCAEISCKAGCFGRGKCVQKKCQCVDGWTSDDCTQKEYKANCPRCAKGDPFRTSCYGDSCECDPKNITCMCRLGLKTGEECATVCVPGWSKSDCAVKEYTKCERCLGGDPFKIACYGDSCACDPSDSYCMCHLGLLPKKQCTDVCGDGWDSANCAKKAYKAKCARCADVPFNTHCYGDGCDCNPTDLNCMCHLGKKTGAACKSICTDGWDSVDCSKKIYTDNCKRCASNPFKTSCYGDSCECNPANTTCMCRLGLKTGKECDAVCVEGWSKSDCGVKEYTKCQRCLGGDPFKTSCYGDSCGCDPKDTYCMCHLGLLPKKQCTDVCTDGWDSANCAKKVYKAKCARCADVPFNNYCYGDECACNPTDLNCQCHLGLKTGTPCKSVCSVEGWDAKDCTKKTYIDNCKRCASNPFKTSCYGDSCECNPANTTCMCRLGLKTGEECANICVEGWSQSNCSLKEYKDKCERCSGGDPFKTSCYGDSCECNPNDLYCMCFLGKKTGTACKSVCSVDGYDASTCKKAYKDKCARCVDQPFFTSCYGEACVCNPNDLYCMCHTGQKTGTACKSICTSDWDPNDCSKRALLVANVADGARSDAVGDQTQLLKDNEGGSNNGIIVGALVGGLLIIAFGLFAGIKLAKNHALKKKKLEEPQQPEQKSELELIRNSPV